MRTMKDITILISKQGMFGNGFNSMIADLSNDYISKSNGIERIAAKLVDWDEEAKQFIVNELIENLFNEGLEGFDANEIIEAIR